MPIPKDENVVAINLKLFHFIFLENFKIEFKMKLQSFYCLEFFQVPAKLDISYLSPHISKWSESKLPMSIKIFKISCNF